jgi:hypothetical protein
MHYFSVGNKFNSTHYEQCFNKLLQNIFFIQIKLFKLNLI